MNLAHFKLHVTAIDPGQPRTRWNGDPMASSDAMPALRKAVDAFNETLGSLGFQVARSGYGVTASRVDDPREGV